MITQTIELQAKMKSIEDEFISIMSTLNLNNAQKTQVNTKIITKYFNETNFEAAKDVNNQWRAECRRKLIGSTEEKDRFIDGFLKTKVKNET